MPVKKETLKKEPKSQPQSQAKPQITGLLRLDEELASKKK